MNLYGSIAVIGTIRCNILKKQYNMNLTVTWGFEEVPYTSP